MSAVSLSIEAQREGQMMKYQVWVTTSSGAYQRLTFSTAEQALYIINSLKEYEDWNFTI